MTRAYHDKFKGGISSFVLINILTEYKQRLVYNIYGV